MSATASKVHLDPSHRPVFAVPHLSSASAERASKLLQENHDKFHIFFNNDGFHNHIAHHLLTIYALGASPDEIQKHYDNNASYQRPPVKLEEGVVKDMQDPKVFEEHLGDENYYRDYLVFFQREIEKKGWQNVIKEYCFKGDSRGDKMLIRLFAGFLHPIIHMGFGVEFGQPAIMAEGLAEAAVHTGWMGDLLLPAEKLAKEHASKGEPPKSLIELLELSQKNEKLVHSAEPGDGNKLRDGVIARAGYEMAELAGHYYLQPPAKSEKEANQYLEEKVAEMTNLCAYFTVTAQRPPHRVKFDFFHIHDLNSTIFFPAFLLGENASWLSLEEKCRLLEWKARGDLAQYVARGSAKLDMKEIDEYVPNVKSDQKVQSGARGAESTHEEEQGWDSLFTRIIQHEDDGHASKVVRALAHAEQICNKYTDGSKSLDWKIKTQKQWLTAGHMAVDSVEDAEGPDWVRSCGFESAWEKVGLRNNPRAGGKREKGQPSQGYEQHNEKEKPQSKV